jgi:hypothetical protein
MELFERGVHYLCMCVVLCCGKSAHSRRAVVGAPLPTSSVARGGGRAARASAGNIS